jgi:putative flippase GtrA
MLGCAVNSRRGLVAELARFGLAGGGVAMISILAYWLAAVPAGLAPGLANLISYLVNLLCGFHAHRRWSFRVAAGTTGESRRMARYAAVSIFAFLMNSVWVWLLTARLGAPSWTPILPMLFATPLCTFALARLWVFGVAKEEPGREVLTLFP